MSNKFAFLLGAAAIIVGVSASALAQAPAVTTKTTTEVVPLTDGAVVYETHKVTKAAIPDGVRPVVFYYYDAPNGNIIAASDLTKDIFNIWDKDRNGYISPQEYYENAMVMYEPIETEKRIFVVDDATGRLKLTQEEYTLRLEQADLYKTINTDKKAGISVYEFVGSGFQEADRNDDDKVSFDELTQQFYNQPRLASDQTLYNN